MPHLLIRSFFYLGSQGGFHTSLNTVSWHPSFEASGLTLPVLMRCFASALFLLAHGLLVLEHIFLGTALHGIAELFLAPWAVRHKAWDLIVIGIVFCVFDFWGSIRFVAA